MSYGTWDNRNCNTNSDSKENSQKDQDQDLDQDQDQEGSEISLESVVFLRIGGAPDSVNELNGIYKQSDILINGKVYFVSQSKEKQQLVHLYWSGSKWILHHYLPNNKEDLEENNSEEDLEASALAYTTDLTLDSPMASKWYVKVGRSFELAPLFGMRSSAEKGHEIEAQRQDPLWEKEEVLGIPKRLFPYYISFLFDAIAVGLVIPLLPFFVMELGADAFKLSLVVSANYVAQTSALSYFFFSRATTLMEVVLARLIAASLGGLVPIMQSAVADVADVDDRPKYIGRIMAVFGLGFVIGPTISAALPHFTAKQKISLAALFPLMGLIVMLSFAKDTKRDSSSSSSNPPGSLLPSSKAKIPLAKHKESSSPPIPIEIMMLVTNGFAVMYAFATETIYAMFLKDSFGYGEHALSTLFAVSGFFIILFQVFLIKPLIKFIGKHATLALGNIILAAGMFGVALVRQKMLHFIFFGIHIIGYSIADTALASLVTKYSSPSSQGRDLAFNQASQSCARVVSPIFAGILYELSKQSKALPLGALPFLAGALCPLVAVLVPASLYIRNIAHKRRSDVNTTVSSKCLEDTDEEDN
eukprot:gene3233-3542_t